ncbi:MAG: DNA polymerase [Desulfonatronovibrio sp.]
MNRLQQLMAERKNVNNPVIATIPEPVKKAAPKPRRPEFEFEYVTDPQRAKDIVDTDLNTQEEIGFDIETSKIVRYSKHPQAGLSPHLSQIRLAQFCANSEKVFVFDVPKIGMDILKPVLERKLVAHNAVFEMSHLYHAGIDLPFMDCTRLMDNAVNNGNSSLKEVTRKYLKFDISKDEQVSDWGATELSMEQLRYAALDAWLVKELYGILSELIVKRNRSGLYKLLRAAQRPVMRMAHTGFNFDVLGHQRLVKSLSEDFKNAEARLKDSLIIEVKISSTKQLSDFYKGVLPSKTLKKWKRTKSGDLCLDKDTIRQFADNPLVEPLAEYKRLKKLTESFGSTMLDYINPATGRIHPSYIIGAARGGRFTCSKPNLQQIPKTQEYRCLFSAPAGRKLVVADYSQVELRVLAMISGEPTMLEAYEKGHDLHKLTASAISGVPFEKVTKEERSAAKAVNFGLVFGMGAKSLAEYARNSYGVKMTSKEAKAAKEAYFTKYPRINIWHAKTTREGHNIGIAKTRMGRVEKLIPERAYTQSKNVPVQGSAAEVLLAALALLDKRIDESGLDIKIVHIVHDEIVLDTAAKYAEQAKDILIEAMTAGMLKVFPEAFTEGLVEAEIADSWGGSK